MPSSLSRLTHLAPSAWDEAVIRRYGTAGPYFLDAAMRAFKADFTATDHAAALSSGNAGGKPLALYVHIPFCRQICFHCAWHTTAVTSSRLVAPYLDRLGREMQLAAAYLGASRPVTQLYWGGGTPAFLGLDQMSELVDRLDASFGLTNSRERDYAIEIDPREANVLTLRHLQALGFNRISLGVQDLDLKVLKAINRAQPRILTESLIDEASRLGFRSLNLDLIHGLPYQTPDSFAKTLAEVIDMAPPRLTIYDYTHLPERFSPQRHIDAITLPGIDEKLATLRITLAMLEQAGYLHLGMGHFALPGDSLAMAQRDGTLRHGVMGYSSHPDSDLVGLGVSAISRISNVYAQNDSDLSRYEAAINGGCLATSHGLRLDTDAWIRQYASERLLCDMALDLDALGEAFGIDAQHYFDAALKKLKEAERDGLITRQGAKLRVTPLGKLLAGQLARILGSTSTVAPR